MHLGKVGTIRCKVGTIWAKLSQSEVGTLPNCVKLALSGLSCNYPRVELDHIELSWHYRRVDLVQICFYQRLLLREAVDVLQGNQ